MQLSKLSVLWMSFLSKIWEEGVKGSPDSPFLFPLPQLHGTSSPQDIYNKAVISSLPLETPTGSELMLGSGQITWA